MFLSTLLRLLIFKPLHPFWLCFSRCSSVAYLDHFHMTHACGQLYRSFTTTCELLSGRNGETGCVWVFWPWNKTYSTWKILVAQLHHLCLECMFVNVWCNIMFPHCLASTFPKESMKLPPKEDFLRINYNK